MVGDNKKTTILLIIIVLAVWTAIVYQIAFNTKKLTIMSVAKANKRDMLYDSVYPVKHSASLKRDPFRIERSATQGNQQAVTPLLIPKESRAKKIQETAQIEKKETDWSIIRFNGSFKNKDSESFTASLVIKGKAVLVNAGDIIDGIKILTVHKDFITINYSDEIKTIHIRN